MKIKKIWMIVSILLVSGCAPLSQTSQNAVEEETTQNEGTEEILMEAVQQESQMRVEFGYNTAVELYTEDVEAQEYRIRLKEIEETEEAVLQEFLITLPSEPRELRIEDICYPDDMIIVCGDAAEGENAFLYLWNYEMGQFRENAIEIPVNYQRCGVYSGGILVPWENDGKKSETIYQVSQYLADIVAVREMVFEPEKGQLEIRDCIQDKTLYSENVQVDENGNLENEEYYRYLFYENLPFILTYEDESMIRTTINTAELWETKEYESKEALLKEWGFEGQKPFFEHRNLCGELEVELYYDEERQLGCGIHYNYNYNVELEESVMRNGFVFEGVESGTWEIDPYRLESVFGGSGSDIKGFTEEYQYREDGKIDYYKSMGEVDSEGGDALERLLEFDFIYRDDGTLAYREYFHHHMVWGTTFQSQRSYYDEQERVVAERGYITHGDINQYYIYTDDGNVPAYCLLLDDQGDFGMTEYK